MTVTLELKPEIEARVRTRAAERGLPVEKFLEATIELDMTRGDDRTAAETITLENWEAALDELIRNSARSTWAVDDSRESIYREREDAQL